MIRYAVVGSLCTAALLLVASSASATVPAGYGIVFNEDFNGNSLQNTKFGYQWTGYEGVRATGEGVSVGGGNLTLTTYSTTTGGSVSNWGGCVATNAYDHWDGTKINWQFTYGYIESRIKFSNDPGNCMAFWLESDYMFNPNAAADGGPGNEVDIIEQRQTDGDNANIPNTDHMTLHRGGYGSNHKQYGTNATISSLEGTFHTFGLLWESTGYHYYVDNVEKWSYTTSNIEEWLLGYKMISHGPGWIVFDSDP